MLQKTVKALVILLLGISGGIIAEFFLIPYSLDASFLKDIDLIKRLKREVIVNPVQQIYIQENQALENSVENVKNAVIEVETGQKRGCGFILTSDGLAVVPAPLLEPASSRVFIGEEAASFRLLKRDANLGLALIKIRESNLKTTPFFDFEKLKAGTSVFLVMTGGENKDTERKINQGIVKDFNKDLIQTNILEKENVSGCPIFTVDGRFLGISRADYLKNAGLYEVSVVPVSVIREFAGI